MARTLERHEEVTIDLLNPDYKNYYNSAIGDWKDRCIRKNLSRKEYRKGGRTKRRAIQRKEIIFTSREVNDTQEVITFWKSDTEICDLTINLINLEEDVD